MGDKHKKEKDKTSKAPKKIKKDKLNKKKKVDKHRKSNNFLAPTPKKQSAQKRKSAKDLMLDFEVPANLGSLEKLKLIYPKLSNTKLPTKKRQEILKECSAIFDDEKCEASTIKFAVDGFKKVFTEQLKDKKFII